MTASPLNARCAASSLSLTDREPWSPHGTGLSYNMQTATRAKFHWCLPESDLTEFLFITTAEPVKYSNDSWDNKRLIKETLCRSTCCLARPVNLTYDRLLHMLAAEAPGTTKTLGEFFVVPTATIFDWVMRDKSGQLWSSVKSNQHKHSRHCDNSGTEKEIFF